MSVAEENNSDVIFFTPLELECTNRLFGLDGHDLVEMSGEVDFRCDNGDFANLGVECELEDVESLYLLGVDLPWLN